MTLAKLYHQEIKHWHLTDAQRGLLIAFLYCLDLRAKGVDFEAHWSGLCNGQSARMEAACACE